MDMIVRPPKSRRLGVSRSVREDYDRYARQLADMEDNSVSDVYNDALKHYFVHRFGDYFHERFDRERTERVA